MIPLELSLLEPSTAPPLVKNGDALEEVELMTVAFSVVVALASPEPRARRSQSLHCVNDESRGVN